MLNLLPPDWTVLPNKKHFHLLGLNIKGDTSIQSDSRESAWITRRGYLRCLWLCIKINLKIFDWIKCHRLLKYNQCCSIIHPPPPCLCLYSAIYASLLCKVCLVIIVMKLTENVTKLTSQEEIADILWEVSRRSLTGASQGPQQRLFLTCILNLWSLYKIVCYCVSWARTVLRICLCMLGRVKWTHIVLTSLFTTDNQSWLLWELCWCDLDFLVSTI